MCGICCVIGFNGVGKIFMFNVMSGCLMVDWGEIWFNS